MRCFSNGEVIHLQTLHEFMSSVLGTERYSGNSISTLQRVLLIRTFSICFCVLIFLDLNNADKIILNVSN